jgi:hypothetical protein
MNFNDISKRGSVACLAMAAIGLGLVLITNANADDDSAWSCTVTSVTSVRGHAPVEYAEQFTEVAKSQGAAVRAAQRDCDKLAKEVNDKAEDKGYGNSVDARCRHDAFCESM